jgi:hypothetical protein
MIGAMSNHNVERTFARVWDLDGGFPIPIFQT